MEPVQPSTVKELAALVRTQGDNLNDLAADLSVRGVDESIIDLVVKARNAAWEAYDELHLAPEPPKHTRNGVADGPWPYGTTHDFACPACLASGASYTSSPRSETYWSS